MVKITIVYKIDEYITLKLEKIKKTLITNIYINGKKFNHCKYLLLNLEVEEIPKYDNFNSIDEIFEYYSRENETSRVVLEPEQEFIGHCSNLQAWVENDYNVNILHTNLSFPLLIRLSYLGNAKAKIVLKEEIAERLLAKNRNTVLYFLEMDYLYLYEIEELEFLFEQIDIKDQDILKKINKLMNHKRIIDKMKKKKHQMIVLEERGWGGY